VSTTSTSYSFDITKLSSWWIAACNYSVNSVHYVYGSDSKEEPMQEEYLKPGDVAKRLGVSRQAVYKWIKEGRLKAVRFGIGKAVRIPRAALEEFERNAAGRDGQGEYTGGELSTLSPVAA